MSDNVSQDFVFGTLATDDLRLAQLRAASAGIHHAHDLEPADPRPGDTVTVRVRVGALVHADRVTCYYTTDGSDPSGERGRGTVGRAIDLVRTAVEWDTLAWAYREAWAGRIPPQPGGTLVRYRIEAWSEGREMSDWASEIAGVVTGDRPPGVSEVDARLFELGGPSLWPVRRRGSYAYHVDEDRVPEWLRDAVIYQVFVDRFATTGGLPFATQATPGGIYGGTLRGVTDHVDYIRELGATCMWLSPVFPSPSHHGYDATDYHRVEPRLGTQDDLRDLVTTAHRYGIRVVLDFVANHVSWEHPAFLEARANHDSPEAGWFTFTHWPDQYLSFFGVQDHPQVDCDDPGAQAYLIDSARQWLDLGVDGFRCDYAIGPSHAFWSAFRAATRAANRDSVTLGEVVDTPALQRTYQGRLDGCLDFLLLQGLRRFFAFASIGPTEFDTFLRRHLAFFPTDFVLPSFLDNHDMNRFLWVVRGDARRLKLAAMCQFTLPHPPIVYYGTEVGLAQQRDVRSAAGSGHPEESRLPMPWGAAQDLELLEFYRRLAALRRAAQGLWRAPRATLETDDETGFFAYRCGDGAAAAIVALNNGPHPRRFRPAGNVAYRLALETDPATTFEGGTLNLPPYGGAVLIAPDATP